MPEDLPVSVLTSRAKLAGLVAHRDPADPAIAQARAELKAAGLEARIRAAVAEWPPLSESVRAELAILLLSAGDDHAAT